MMYQRWMAAGLMATLATVASLAVLRPLPAQAQAAGNRCLIADLRDIGLNTHDVKERADKAIAWLRRVGNNCTQSQMLLIGANRSSWLGNADTAEVSRVIDGLIEARIVNNPELLGRMYGSRSIEQKPASAAITSTPTPPAPVVAGTPAVVGAPGVVAAVPAAAPASPARRASAPARPASAPPKFKDEQAKAVAEFFTAQRGPGNCPTGMMARGERCESMGQRPWKPGEALPGTITPEDLPAALIQKLGLPPAGHRYVKVASDILLLSADRNVVVDAVLDMGGLPPKNPAPAAPASAPASGASGPAR